MVNSMYHFALRTMQACKIVMDANYRGGMLAKESLSQLRLGTRKLQRLSRFSVRSYSDFYCLAAATELTEEN